MYTITGSRKGYGETGLGPKRRQGLLSRLLLMNDERIGRHIAEETWVTVVEPQIRWGTLDVTTKTSLSEAVSTAWKH